jgi:hypothetical protein
MCSLYTEGLLALLSPWIIPRHVLDFPDLGKGYSILVLTGGRQLEAQRATNIIKRKLHGIILPFIL